jgi:hypothetical protein
VLVASMMLVQHTLGYRLLGKACASRAASNALSHGLRYSRGGVCSLGPVSAIQSRPISKATDLRYSHNDNSNKGSGIDPPVAKRPRGRPRIYGDPNTLKPPLILLDVDGVINLSGTAWELKTRWPDYKIVYNIQAGNGGYTICYSQTVVDKINEWSEVADVRWLTTWNEYAIKNLAPALGLKKFPQGRAPGENTKKVNSVLHHANTMGSDRLLIWIDDENKNQYFRTDYQYAADEGEVLIPFDDPLRGPKRRVFERKNTLLVSPRVGLTKEHLAVVDGVLANPKAWQGKYIEEFEV